MHYTKGGQQGAAKATTSSKNPFPAEGTDPSSTCLTCIWRQVEQPTDGPLRSTNDADMTAGVPPSQLTPGGDFGWLKKSYSWGWVRPGRFSAPPKVHGHNIVAQPLIMSPTQRMLPRRRASTRPITFLR